MTSTAFARWHQHRMAIVTSQIAPTFLLISTIALLQFGLAEADMAIRLATAGILLASGILGALVQFTAAHEAKSLARDIEQGSQENLAIRQSGGFLWVVQVVTPTIFVVIYLALMFALFG
jgi:hypothetical protein